MTNVVVKREAWEGAWRRLGGVVPPAGEYDNLVECYAQRHRVYHTLKHLEECLTQLDQVRRLCSHPDEIALALWYHDAIYKPRRSDNEARSADWLARVANQVEVPAAAVSRMRELVLATRHNVAPMDMDAQILVDIDLSILGASAERFDEYEKQVRREYRWVPLPLYRAQRSKVLKSFIERPRIYTTEHYFSLEKQARENIELSLARLV
ncbi:MAG: HD domain-containing protein, partial [Rudaea sp.]